MLFLIRDLMKSMSEIGVKMDVMRVPIHWERYM